MTPMTQKSKPPALFLGSLLGLLGVGGVFWAIATEQFAYASDHMVSVEVTAPNEWKKVCGRFRAVKAFVPLYMQSKTLPMAECDRRDAMEAASVIEYLEAECPGGSCEQPAGPTEGRMMAMLWEDRQEFEASTGFEHGNFTVFFWDFWLKKRPPVRGAAEIE